jgi:peptide/nickel transport system permease protein
MGWRPSLTVGISAPIATAGIGTAVGLLSGYSGGVLDQMLMRVADIVLGLPFLALVIVATALLGARLQNIVLAVGIMLWPNAARVIRSQC